MLPQIKQAIDIMMGVRGCRTPNCIYSSGLDECRSQLLYDGERVPGVSVGNQEVAAILGGLSILSNHGP